MDDLSPSEDQAQRDRAVGIFDSGVGGLTVANEIYKALPYESTMYLGDTARVPYGTRSKETVVKFSLEDAKFLVDKGVKAIVVACNTASSLALEEVQSAFDRNDWQDLPVFGVVEPAAYAAYQATKKGKIGLIGTPGTINSGAHERAIKKLAPQAKVFPVACPLLVPLIEDGRLSGPLIEAVVGEYLAPFRKNDIDTLILGCTHYPLLKDIINDFLWAQVKLIDPGEAVARELANGLEKRGLTTRQSAAARHQYFVTDDSPSFRGIAEKFLGEPVENLAKVNL